MSLIGRVVPAGFQGLPDGQFTRAHPGEVLPRFGVPLGYEPSWPEAERAMGFGPPDPARNGMPYSAGPGGYGDYGGSGGPGGYGGVLGQSGQSVQVGQGQFGAFNLAALFNPGAAGAAAGGTGPQVGVPWNGSGGYRYILLTNGSIMVVSGPTSNGAIFPVNSTAWIKARSEAPGSTLQAPAPAAMPTAPDNPDAAAAAAPAGLFNGLFSALGGGDPAAGKQAVGAAVAQYGPLAAQAISNAIANRGQSMAALQKKLVQAQADYMKYRTSNYNKALKAMYTIRALQAQIQQAQQTAAQIVPDYNVPPPVQPEGVAGVPTWAIVAASVGVVTIVGALLLARGRGQASNTSRRAA